MIISRPLRCFNLNLHFHLWFHNYYRPLKLIVCFASACTFNFLSICRKKHTLFCVKGTRHLSIIHNNGLWFLPFVRPFLRNHLSCCSQYITYISGGMPTLWAVAGPNGQLASWKWSAAKRLRFHAHAFNFHNFLMQNTHLILREGTVNALKNTLGEKHFTFMKGRS